jgi:hypothetical protein
MSKYVLFLIATLALADTAPITDEDLRMTALRAIFPGMRISLVPGKRIALAKESVYRVVGKATNESEECASEDLRTAGKFVDVRLLRFQMFRWPNSSGLLAVLQYNFEGANPAGPCWSVGFLARMEDIGGQWKVQERYSLNAHHQSMLMSVRLLDLTGDGVDELVVEPNFGGAGTWGSSLQIFDLSHSRFEEILYAVSRISQGIDEMYTQALDVPKTIKQGGAQFCFTKTTMFEGGKPAIPIRITKPCYKRGEGVDGKQSDERNKMLKP